MAKKVTIYSRIDCASCGMVKKYLTMKNVDYNVIDLDEHPELAAEVMAKSGVQTIPVTMVQDEATNKESIIVGWNPGKLAEAIA